MPETTNNLHPAAARRDSVSTAVSTDSTISDRSSGGVLMSPIGNHTVCLWQKNECSVIAKLMGEVVKQRTLEKDRYEKASETKKMNISLCLGDIIGAVITTIAVASLFLPVVGQLAAFRYILLGISVYSGLNCIYGSSKVFSQALGKLKEVQKTQSEEASKLRKELLIQIFLGMVVMGLGVLLTLIGLSQIPGLQGSMKTLSDWIIVHLKNNPMPLASFTIAIMSALALDTWPRIIERLQKKDLVSKLHLQEDINTQNINREKIDEILQDLINQGIIPENIMTAFSEMMTTFSEENTIKESEKAQAKEFVQNTFDSIEAKSHTKMAIAVMDYLQTLFEKKAQLSEIDALKENDIKQLQEKADVVKKIEKVSKKVLGIRVSQQILNLIAFIITFCPPVAVAAFFFMISANFLAFGMDSKYPYDRNTPYQIPKEKANPPIEEDRVPLLQDPEFA